MQPYARIPDYSLAHLREAHPRLLASVADFLRLRNLVRSDPTASTMFAALKAQADAMLGDPPPAHALPLLDTSRLCLRRIYTLALLYKITEEKAYRERALQELLTAAAFPDWQPDAFLALAEMTHAVAIGYDWLYDDLSDADRVTLAHALVKKGLNEAVVAYQSNAWWTRANNNWNLVCNAGVGLGALAVADYERQTADFIVKRSIASLPVAMRSYAPDGGWAEGPGYWNYATSYVVYYLAGLQSALGTDFGLARMAGFAHTGDFKVYLLGPGGAFDFADSHPDVFTSPAMYWLAAHFDQPTYAWLELALLREHANGAGYPKFTLDPLQYSLGLLWYDPAWSSAPAPDAGSWPLSKVFTGVHVAFLRTSWTDPRALWIGLKGGDNQANHSHLDAGSFVLDKRGVRWALDLGADNYSLPGYFRANRYTYYRTGSASHNTVLINGQNQSLTAKAPVYATPGAATSFTIDLAETYPGILRGWKRVISVDPVDQSARIQDAITADSPVSAVWQMLTDAHVSVTGSHARLSRDGVSLDGEIVAPVGAVFDTAATTPPAPENPTTGTTKLIVRLPENRSSTEIDVLFH